MSVTARFGGDVSGTEPSPSIWNRFNALDCLLHKKGYEFWDDFRTFGGIVTSNVGNLISGSGRWLSYEDTGDSLLQVATDPNGVVAAVVAATNNNETWMMPGAAAAVGFCPRTAANGGTSIFFEARVKMSQITSGNFFIGLSEEGLAAADTISDSDAIADKDFIGFLTLEAAPTLAAFKFNKASAGGVTAVIASAHTYVADTYVKLGFIIDMEEPDNAKRIKAFVNGVELSTYGTNTQFVNTTIFPTGEEMHVLFGAKNQNAAKTVSIDWVRVGQMRVS